VLATVPDSVDLGYRVIVVKDGLATHSMQHTKPRSIYTPKAFDIQIEFVKAGEVPETWRP
jgi:nicotinamidase-related amidase